MTDPMAGSWWPAAFTLGSAGVVGCFAAWWAARQAPPLKTWTKRSAQGQVPPLSELDETLGQQLAWLKELEESQDKLTAQAYQAQKAEIERRAAQSLKARTDMLALQSARRDVSTPPPRGWMGFFRARPQLRGALWGGGCVALVAVLCARMLRAPQETARPERPDPSAAFMPAQPGLSQAGGPVSGAPMPMNELNMNEFKALHGRLTQHPDDTEALLRLSHLLLKAQMFPEAQVVNDRALKLNPDNPEAQVHEAMLRAGAGDSQEAWRRLDAVVQQQPGFAEAWFFRGMLAMQAGQKALMRENFKQFVAVAPEGPQRERIRSLLQAP